ncbi:hypothetical protein JL475_33545 [Streptomyces sp. M2CJ-2]|uniref:hypothetical protein n=1 Tax=Streptomyces sp. M2CJ-2 TaxID=2803948 RepID=UPI001928AACC|nr:hypothetical protein [Streptomyces sp. M2CJ-2]MBL3670798.1 hypothetical protein [Streptomyces sp. M2CJ-2]
MAAQEPLRASQEAVQSLPEASRGPITALVAAELADELIATANADRHAFTCGDTVDEVAAWLRGHRAPNPTPGEGESGSLD